MIGIGEQQHFSTRMQHAVAHAVSFATIARIFQQPEAGIHCRIFASDFSGIIARAIVYNYNFRIPATLCGVGQNSIQRRPDARALVICGDDDAVSAVASRWSLIVGQGLQCRALFSTVPRIGHESEKAEWKRQRYSSRPRTYERSRNFVHLRLLELTN